MDLNKPDFQKAQEEGIISTEQVDQLLAFFSSQNIETETKAKFNITNFLYYFGAVLIILSMGWFMGNVWGSYGENGLFVICLVYMAFFTLIGNYLWGRGLKTPGGLLYVASVSAVPIITYLFEKITGIWPINDPGNYSGFHIWIRGSWVLMEIMTIVVGLIYLKYRKIPFLTAPIAFSLWYLSMDIVPLLFGKTAEPTWDERKIVSLIFGLLMIAVAFIYDKKTKGDFSFWLYLFGSFAFWFGLNFVIWGHGEFSYFIYALINLSMMFISILLQRKIFMVFGSLGILGYLGHLSYDLFKNSAVFPLALIATGLIIIFLGVTYQKNQEKLENYIESLIPENFKKYLPKYRI
ncbi:MAG: DUF2157 domain-containing protein [bacterium]